MGRYLLDAVDSVLGDAVTAKVHAAWDVVYWLFAAALVAAEGRLYERSGVDMAHSWRPWRVADHAPAGEDVVTLELVPADGGPIPAFLPGQYVTVEVALPGGIRQARQYSLSCGPGRPSLQIAVRRERGDALAPDGVVSRHLHDVLRVGDVLQRSVLVGDPPDHRLGPPGLSAIDEVSSERDHGGGQSLALVPVGLIAPVEHIQQLRVSREHRVVERSGDVRAMLHNGRERRTDEDLGLRRHHEQHPSGGRWVAERPWKTAAPLSLRRPRREACSDHLGRRRGLLIAEARQLDASQDAALGSAGVIFNHVVDNGGIIGVGCAQPFS